MASKQLKNILFSIMLLMLLVDRMTSLYFFNFKYSDIDQLVMWNGAVDYANGIFHEPYFYGQAYNYMLESLISVPLLFANVPVFKALPIATTFLGVLPYVIFASILLRKNHFFWSISVLAIAIMLPVEFNFLTAISRGFVQAFLFFLLLFLPLLHPTNKKYIPLLFITTGISFIANQSAILLLFPTIMYVASYHYKSTKFYFQILWIIPFLILDSLSKYYYKIHPEKVLLEISGLKLDLHTFIETITNPNKLEFLLPFHFSNSYFYLIILFVLAIVAFKIKSKHVFCYIVSAIFLILFTFAIPKVQGEYPIKNAGIFYTVSRFYLTLPILLISALFLVFSNFIPRIRWSIFMVILCCMMLFTKYHTIEHTVHETISNTSFPVFKNQNLINQVNEIKKITQEKNIDLVVFALNPSWDWTNLYTAYAFNPLCYLDKPKVTKQLISVNITGDRRTWLYQDAYKCNQILTVGIPFTDSELKKITAKKISENIVHFENKYTTTKLFFTNLKTNFGIIPTK
jgi:hypothetical protein